MQERGYANITIGAFYMTLQKNEAIQLKKKGIEIDFISNPTFLLRKTNEEIRSVFKNCVIWNHTIGYNLRTLDNYINIAEETFKCEISDWNIISHQEIINSCTDIALNAMVERTPYKGRSIHKSGIKI